MTESAPPGRTGFALGLAMSVNQIAIVVVPPALGLLKDVTHSFVPAWSVVTTMTAVALTSRPVQSVGAATSPLDAGQSPHRPDTAPPERADTPASALLPLLLPPAAHAQPERGATSCPT
ncbi:hypothetical protein ACFV8T_14795 [Streptomyces sp. NPDC059832]|uniref:hypothetical protein n=1 Tax=Streptomyces sp. NPDC059832 TaxID=3346966 RepID=UPI003666F655